MQVKGTGIKTTKEFVKSNFPDGYDNWIKSLSVKSKKLYSVNTQYASWFPIHEAYIEPTDKILELFYNGNRKEGADAIGRFSADYALKGIYKVFLLVASPQFLMKRATKIITTFYEPCEISISEKEQKSIVLVISKFDEINEVLEYRIGAWCQRALELAHCKNVNYKIQKSLTKKDFITEINFSWE
ncbi:MAG: hypothetical protein JEY96_16450 [Bacteroidales bacterium]|nr:hypothetical protein [Bacteroidales bacterium]